MRALWSILTEAGMRSDTIAWWATWPAEEVLGHMVSDRVAYSTFPIKAVPGEPDAVHPPDYAATVDTVQVCFSKALLSM